MKSIKDAYEELKGDLNNTRGPADTDEYLYFDVADSEFICLSYRDGLNGIQYICTVEEFNNYKGDDVKTVSDAVIEFKGEYFDGECGGEKHQDQVLYAARDFGSYRFGDIHIGSGNSKDNTYWKIICMREEFNTLVDELSTNYGTSETYADYKANYSVINYDMSPLIVKPVYTQVMCDAGELPSVGMEYLDDDGQISKCLVNYGDITIGLNIEHVETENYLPISQTSRGNCKPLTPPIELIDGKAYQFQAHKNRNPVDGFYSADEDEFVYLQGTVRSHDAINIQLLEVKS